MELGGGPIPGIPWKWCQVSDPALQLFPPVRSTPLPPEMSPQLNGRLRSRQLDNLHGWELLSSSFPFLSSRPWNLGAEGARAELEVQGVCGGDTTRVWAGRSSVLRHLTAVPALLPPSPLFSPILGGVLILAHYFRAARGPEGHRREACWKLRHGNTKVSVNSFGRRDCNYFESRLEQDEELGQLALWTPGPCRSFGLVFQ